MEPRGNSAAILSASFAVPSFARAPILWNAGAP